MSGEKVVDEEVRRALDMAHIELTRLGNALNWDPPIAQTTADAVNAIRWVKGEAEWAPATMKISE